MLQTIGDWESAAATLSDTVLLPDGCTAQSLQADYNHNAQSLKVSFTQDSKNHLAIVR
jgi:hypothetical protein